MRRVEAGRGYQRKVQSWSKVSGFLNSMLFQVKCKLPPTVAKAIIPVDRVSSLPAAYWQVMGLL